MSTPATSEAYTNIGRDPFYIENGIYYINATLSAAGKQPSMALPEKLETPVQIQVAGALATARLRWEENPPYEIICNGESYTEENHVFNVPVLTTDHPYCIILKRNQTESEYQLSFDAATISDTAEPLDESLYSVTPYYVGAVAGAGAMFLILLVFIVLLIRKHGKCPKGRNHGREKDSAGTE